MISVLQEPLLQGFLLSRPVWFPLYLKHIVQRWSSWTIKTELSYTYHSFQFIAPTLGSPLLLRLHKMNQTFSSLEMPPHPTPSIINSSKPLVSPCMKQPHPRQVNFTWLKDGGVHSFKILLKQKYTKNSIISICRCKNIQKCIFLSTFGRQNGEFRPVLSRSRRAVSTVFLLLHHSRQLSLHLKHLDLCKFSIFIHSVWLYVNLIVLCLRLCLGVNWMQMCVLVATNIMCVNMRE